MEDTKICPVCNIDKPKSEYHKLSTSASGVQTKCKACTSDYKKQRYWTNHEVELAKMTKSRLKPENVSQRKEYYNKNKEQYADRYKKYISDETVRQNKLEYGRKLHASKREVIHERKREYHKRPEVKERQREIHKIRKETDIQYNIKRRLRFRLRNAVKDISVNKFKRKSSIELLGCSLEFFKKYIEDKFTDGMNWDKLPEIHIDHIKPCIKFDLTKEEEQLKCFNYTNLQPLWAVDNHIKNAKYEEVCQNQ